MAEYSANAVQTVNPGESVVFTTTVVPCNRGFVRHRPETGNFLLAGWVPRNQNGCCCNRTNAAMYLTDFSCNIAVPDGGTVETISLAFSIDGATVPASQMDSTPTAVEDFNNVSVAITVPVWRGCCQTLSVRNITDEPILVKNANIIFSRPDLAVTY